MRLFISYSRDDQAWVYTLRDALRADADHDVWIDRRLVPAQDWWQTILDNVAACECFVYVLTPMSVASIYCRAELDYALALNKPVLPLMLKPCDIPASIKHIQVQAITDDMSLDKVLLRVERGLHAVQRGLDQGRYAPVSAPRPAQPTPAAEPQQVAEVYLLAEEAAADNNISLAEQLFKQVMVADSQGWGVAAAERLAELRLERDRSRDYLVIVRLARNPAQASGARAAARAYVHKYGADHDPNALLAALLEAAAPPAQDAPAAAHWVALRQTLGSRLSLDELRDAALDLGIDYEGLEKGELIRRLILSLAQRGRLDQLLAWLRQHRPDIDTTPLAPPPSDPAPTQPPTPPPTAPAAPHLGDRMDDNGVTMVYVPPGTFTMGGDDITDDEKPPHEVVIRRGFWLDLTPVTNAMYARFVEAGGYKKRDFWTEAGWEWVQQQKKTGPVDYEGFTAPRQPRVGVTWFEAYAYGRWRGGRLPTEAEWEWAARGPENRVYPWGNDFDAARVVYDQNSGGKTATVNASTRLAGASWVGALDMSGNVWEWVSSIYLSYPYKVEDGRESQEDDSGARVVRGGSRVDDELNLRAAYRFRDYPAGGYGNRGFRCARSS